MISLSKSILFFLFFSIISLSYSQHKKKIELEDIWARATFRGQYTQGFNWLKGDRTYASVRENKIERIDLATGKPLDVLFSNPTNIPIADYQFNEQEDKILLASETTPVYRHSSVSRYYVYDIKSGKLQKLHDDKISNCTFSPDGFKVGYVYQNNLFYVDLQSFKTTQVTEDGKANFIINGSADWVYEEEFSFTKGFFWSPDSRKIVFYRFDESNVREYNLQLWDSLYPTDYRYKYPKAGEDNSIVTVHCYFLDSGKTIALSTGKENDVYIPRVQWTNHPDIVSIQKLNRLQNHFQLLHANIASGDVKVVYSEQNNTYVEINDYLTYLADGKHFILTSEKDGFRHLYKFEMNGKPAGQLTRGNWEVDQFLGVNGKEGMLYYTSTEISPLERHLFSTDLFGKKKRKLTEKKGVHGITFSKGFKYFIDAFSTLNSPHQFTLHQTSNGKPEKVLVSNEALIKKLEEYRISPATYFSFETHNTSNQKNLPEKISLDGYMIKPQNMDPSKKYPVLLFVYGGPGHQSVTDSWKGPNYLWFQMLAQEGYVVVSIDNRGTGGRGADFKKLTQNNLGKYETEDVIRTAAYLGELPYIDESRIGIFGWSFGGYLSSLAMTLGADYFKTGIAVAPVTNWRFYDTIYTERYLGLPKDNPEGYNAYSPVTHADKLKGNYLLIHGTADDNVHLQNSYALQEALIKANKQFSTFYYPDKNHGIYGGITRYHLYRMMTEFIFEKL